MFCTYIVYNSDKDIIQMSDRQATDPTSRQRGRPHRQDCNYLKIKINKQISGHMPQMGHDAKTDRLTDWLSVAMWLWLWISEYTKWFYYTSLYSTAATSPNIRHFIDTTWTLAMIIHFSTAVVFMIRMTFLQKKQWGNKPSWIRRHVHNSKTWQLSRGCVSKTNIFAFRNCPMILR
jgi:hypothetical protein